jgi:hypothetical protein
VTNQHSILLPTDHQLGRAPQRSQLAALRVALALAEHALLRNHQGLRWSRAPAPGDPNTLVVACALLPRMRDLQALIQAYDQLLDSDPTAEPDDDIPF